MRRPAFSLTVLTLTILLLGLLVSTVFAGFNSEPFESENYYSYGGNKDGVFSLSFVGIGGGRCDWSDYRFRINVNRSFAGNDWKFYSSNSAFQRTPTGRTFYGYALDTASPYVCIGTREFLATTPGRWMVADVERNVYVWRR